MSPSVGYGGSGPAAGGGGGAVHEVPAILLQKIPESDLHSLASLVHVQLGQIVRNSAVAVVMTNCSRLKQFHCNSCPDLRYENCRGRRTQLVLLLCLSSSSSSPSQGRGPPPLLDARRLPGRPRVLLHLRGASFDLRRLSLHRGHLPHARSLRQPHPMGRRLRGDTECRADRPREQLRGGDPLRLSLVRPKVLLCRGRSRSRTSCWRRR